MERFRNRKTIVILVIILALCVSLFAYFLTRNPYGESVEIGNLNKYTSGKPSNQDRINWIKSALYQTVSLNTDANISGASIDDAVVRDDSFSQSYNEDKDIYTVKFIVDIKSLKQSYSASYEWSDKDKFSVSEYGTQVTCLPIDKLIYGDFNCVDERIKEQGVDKYDPVGQLLPYRVGSKYLVYDYRKALDPDSGKPEIYLMVEVFSVSWEPEITPQLLEKYKKDINNWLDSKKLDHSNYIIKFEYEE